MCLKTLTEIQELRDIYGVKKIPQIIKIDSSEINNIDIYTALLKVLYLIDALGIPKLHPSEIMGIAIKINNNLNTISRSLNVPPVYEDVINNKSQQSISNLYKESYNLLNIIEKITIAYPNNNIKGGIAKPRKKRRNINILDIMLLLTSILDDTNALKNKITNSSDVIDHNNNNNIKSVGTTFNDVNLIITHSQKIVNNIIDYKSS